MLELNYPPLFPEGSHVVRTEEAGRRRTRKGFGLRRRVPMGEPDLRAVPQVVAVERVNLCPQPSVTCDVEQDASPSWFQFVQVVVAHDPIIITELFYEWHISA